MGMYAVQNNKGEWLSFDASHESVWYPNNPTLFKDKNYAEAQNTGLDGSHVVELTEVPAKVVVSEAESEMLEQAKDDYCAASVISAYSTEHIGAMGQDRLMRAYVVGWTVEKPKRYLVYKRLPGKLSYDSNDSIQARKVKMTQGLVWRFVNKESLDTDDYFQFTDAEIEQYGLQGCERVEVNDDDQ